MTTPKHTPGPLIANMKTGRIYLAPTSMHPPMDPGQQTPVVANIQSYLYSMGDACTENEADIRLLTAAYNSYDKHCGANAVECAEGDLLGEALEACKAFDAWIVRNAGQLACCGWMVEDVDGDGESMPIGKLRAVLAKTTKEQP